MTKWIEWDDQLFWKSRSDPEERYIQTVTRALPKDVILFIQRSLPDVGLTDEQALEEFKQMFSAWEMEYPDIV